MDRATRFSQRLSFRQTRYTLIVAFITGLAFSLVQISLDYHYANRAIDDEISALLEISSAPAARIAYNIDTDLAKELLGGLMRSPSIINAEIRDDSGQKLGGITRELRQDQARWISDVLFERSRIYRHDLRVDYDPDEQLGYLQLEIDTYNYGITFIQRALTTFFTGLIKGFAMAIILLLLFYRMLTRPLTSLTESLSKLRNHEQTGSQLPCPKGHSRNEIGLLVNEINNLLYSINSNAKRRFRAERQLRNHLSTLEANISNRTAELNSRNTQLIESNRELEKARQDALQMAQARATLLAGMSHEIRTPLSSLLGLVDLSTHQATDRSQKHRLMMARDSGQQLLQLINDILDFSRFESGKLIFESIPFDLHDALENTINLFSEQAFQKRLLLQGVVHTSVPRRVIGDPTRLQQIITNLLSNALKFTKQGQIAVYAQAEPDVRKGYTRLKLTVKDTGMGIPEDRLETIFQAFTQASDDTSRLFGGTGLGLTLSRNMAEAIGGKLQAFRNPACGTSFELLIPFKVEPSESPPAPPASRPRVITLAQPLLQEALHQYAGDAGLELRCLSWYGPWPEPILQQLQQYPLVTTLPPGTIPKTGRYIPLNHHQNIQHRDFTLYLPLTRAAVHALATELRKTSAALPLVQSSDQAPPVTIESGHTVLVVEDNPTNLMVTKGILEQMGYRVKTARNGQQCLDLLQQSGPEQEGQYEILCDLILMDCNMPVLNGYEASRALRQQSRYRDIPIIALTANAFEHDRERCLEYGMQDYISKPFNRKILQQKLQYWLKNPAPSTLPSPETPVTPS